MPYIITERGSKRYAVATLEDARAAVENAATDAYGYARVDVATIPAEGRTVGPLPDGTVIEVQSVCWNWIIGMADDAGIDTEAIHADGGDLAIIDAYNAAA